MMTRFAGSGETVVQVELPAVEISFSGLSDVDEFQKMWDRMDEAALDPQQSARMIRRLVRGTR
jgi:hypothetical protein